MSPVNHDYVRLQKRSLFLVVITLATHVSRCHAVGHSVSKTSKSSSEGEVSTANVEPVSTAKQKRSAGANRFFSHNRDAGDSQYVNFLLGEAKRSSASSVPLANPRLNRYDPRAQQSPSRHRRQSPNVENWPEGYWRNSPSEKSKKWNNGYSSFPSTGTSEGRQRYDAFLLGDNYRRRSADKSVSLRSHQPSTSYPGQLSVGNVEVRRRSNKFPFGPRKSGGPASYDEFLIGKKKRREYVAESDGSTWNGKKQSLTDDGNVKTQRRAIPENEFPFSHKNDMGMTYDEFLFGPAKRDQAGLNRE